MDSASVVSDKAKDENDFVSLRMRALCAFRQGQAERAVRLRREHAGQKLAIRFCPCRSK